MPRGAMNMENGRALVVGAVLTPISAANQGAG